jgi:hypothetical protein
MKKTELASTGVYRITSMGRVPDDNPSVFVGPAPAFDALFFGLPGYGALTPWHV